MVRVTVTRINVLGTIHALLRCYTVYIIGTTRVFGCSGLVCSLAGTVCQVVLQAMLKTGTIFENHTSNGHLHLQMVKNNFPAYLFALITFKLNFPDELIAMSPSPGQVAK